jgi:hypothetical protein
MDEDAAVAELEQVWRSYVPGDPRAQLAAWRQREPDIEHRLTIPSPASEFVLALVCSRYGVEVYRHPRQRQSTMCIKVPRGFGRQVLWPVFETMTRVLEGVLEQTARRVMGGWSRSLEQERG